MLFSRGKDQEAEVAKSSPGSASPSTSSAAAAPVAVAVDEAEWQAKGAAGLGAISSLSPECTLLKHRYDSCFNPWFKDYLAIGDDQIREQQQQGEAAASEATSSAASSSGSKKRSSWFSDSSSSSSSSTAASSISDSHVQDKKQAIMDRYDRDCGKLFKDYQACVRVSTVQSNLLCLQAEVQAEELAQVDDTS